MQALQLHLLLPALIGILIQIFVVKIPSLQKRAKAANVPFSMQNYLKNDWVTIVGSFLTVLMFLVAWDEIVGLHEAINNYSKWFIAFVGYTGSSIIQSAFGITGNLIQKVVDVKSNVADGVIPPVNEGNKEGVEVIQKDKL